MLEIKWWLALAVVGILIFMAITRSVREPLKWMGYSVLYTAMGGVVLFLLNLFGQQFHLEIPINPFSAFITGFLGVGGVLYLLAVNWLFLT